MIIVPKAINLVDESINIEDFEGGVVTLKEFQGDPLLAKKNTDEIVACYVLHRNNMGALFEVLPNQKFLLCSYLDAADSVFLIKREKVVQSDFPDQVAFVELVKETFEKNPGHGMCIIVDNERFLIDEFNMPLPDVEGVISVTITPYLRLPKSYPSELSKIHLLLTDDFIEGALVLDISQSNPVCLRAYPLDFSQSAVADSKKMEKPVSNKGNGVETGFERFFSEHEGDPDLIKA